MKPEDSRKAMPMAPLHGVFTCVGIATLLSIAACDARGQSAKQAVGTPAALQSPEVQALLEKTRQNLRFVQGGSFQMGDFGAIDSPEKLPYSPFEDNKPLHKVTLDSFSINAYKASYADLDVYSEATGKPKVGIDKGTLKHRYAPAAAGLKWQEAQDYCHWLGTMLKLPMDLPTEAQWEYAARDGGRMVVFATDNGKVEPGRNIWEYQQRADYIVSHQFDDYSPSLPLGQFPPTPLGLYDMMTDGFEWMGDWYDPTYYGVSPEKNPPGPSSGHEKVLRSFRGSNGKSQSFGDGMTFARSHRPPDPPKVDYKGAPRPDRNMTADTTARCVVNSPLQLDTPYR